MLEHYLQDEAVIARLRETVLGQYLDSFVECDAKLGYAPLSVREHVRVLAGFARWMEKNELRVGDLNDGKLSEFLNEQPRGFFRRGNSATLRRFLERLRQLEVVGASCSENVVSPYHELETRYAEYLRNNRGLAPKTSERYLSIVQHFLRERFGDGTISCCDVTEADIRSFLYRRSRSITPRHLQLVVTALRSFFRFLNVCGDIDRELAATIPSVANWRQSTVPKYLKPEEVELLLASCDTSQIGGQRNYTILLLLARLGLRANEVVTMMLDDIDWRAGELTVRGKGQHADRLPLPSDVGEAIADYLLHGRPQCSTRRIFIRSRAPHRGFASPAAICTIVQRALARAGLKPAHKGAHILRYSLATRMLRQGASLGEVGEVLRHRLSSTTEIYAKVDFNELHKLAQPWPLAEGAR